MASVRHPSVIEGAGHRHERRGAEDIDRQIDTSKEIRALLLVTNRHNFIATIGEMHDSLVLP